MIPLVKMKLAICIFLWVLCGIAFLLNIAGLICPPELWGASVGNPRVLVRRNDFMCTGIKQIVADDDAIYILFGQYGVVQVYSKTGSYSHTISVYDHLNGRTEIATRDGLLYIKDKVNNIYIFDGQTLVDFVDRKDSSVIRRTINFETWNSRYCVRNSSVWHISDDSDLTSVIDRAGWLSVYQGSVLWLCMGVLVVLSWAVLLFPVPGAISKKR